MVSKLLNRTRGEAFSSVLMREVKQRFLLVDHDHHGRERLYFDNAGGSFRLKAAVERFAQVDAIPDNAERIHATAVELQDIQARGSADLRTILNAQGGSVYASLTASGAMFDMVRAVAENVPGTNMVTTVLEHPSAFDAMSLYADRLGRELRVAPSNPVTGGVDVDAIVGLVDQGTCLLNVIYASNISGAKLDIEEIVRRARAIKPDLYIVVDAVQHAPHGLIDLQKTPVDGINIAPYKFFGCRGSGLTWVSDRAAVLPHHKLAGKKPDYWDLGSAAPWQFAVLTEIVDYVCWLGSHFTDATDRRALFVAGITHIELHERALLATLLEGTPNATGLREIKGVNVFLDHEDLSKRDLILGIGFDRIDCTQAVVEYGKRGVTVYERVATSIYSKRMLESFGLAGTVRVSPLHCNSIADMEKFLRITREIAADIGVS
ncbi:aminotransferase class V-fold PLP-dependent enzyme [Variovorax sp. PAMC26660]|uniref:aminotransferase class V-fold PLP-dependent enzyme n=1 Tax=Variovorax sp. PAMC26660 TaxID=2762322 RepID=UPI00164D0CDC|nr:aminotransferase class V-fold PLP-dependent enzyme [Variovorax sp. PAMC26660]QNK65254.1 aminotransferase class V-fold PLP-dependent enzyme [Variovorax sp. PAMC26660]